MVTVVTAPQDLLYQSCFHCCRSVHLEALILFSKERAITFLNLPLDPESMTDSHTHFCFFFVSLTSPLGGSAILKSQKRGGEESLECGGGIERKKNSQRLGVAKQRNIVSK